MNRARVLREHPRLLEAFGSIVGFLALGVFLWPVTRTWYLGDDAFVAFYADAVTLQGDSLTSFIFNDAQRAVTELGRFSPLGYAILGGYSFTPSILVFKIGVVIVTLASVALAAELLRQLGFGWAYAALFPIAFCAFLQLRYWHDPILAYGAGMPVVACLTLASLILFARAQRQRRWLLHASALGLFTAACLYWEGSPFLMPLVVPVAWTVGGGPIASVIRRSAPYAVIAASFVVLTLVLRAGAPTESQTANLYQPNLAPRAIASGLARQISGGVPLSYFVAVARAPDALEGLPPERSTSPYGGASSGVGVPSGFVDSEEAMILAGLRRPQGLLVLALVLMGLALTLPHAARTTVSKRCIVGAATLGAWLAVGAALPLAISARWQQETFWGVAYIPVFLEYLGVAITATALLALAHRATARNRRASVAVSVVVTAMIAACATATNALNLRVIDAFGGVKTVMSFNEDAAGAGILRYVEASDEILLDETAPLSPPFLTVIGRTPVPPTFSLATVAARFATCRAASPTCPNSLSRVAYLSRLDSLGVPWAAVCKVDDAVSRRAGAPACNGEIVVAVREDDRAGEPCQQLVFDAAARNVPLTSRSGPLRQITASRNVVLCKGRLHGPVLVQSINVGQERDATEGPLRVVSTNPTEVRAGQSFNVQPDGESAIGVTAVGATPSTRVVMNGVELPSRYVDSRLVTALVAGPFFAAPGRLEVRLRDRGVSSNARFITVRP